MYEGSRSKRGRRRRRIFGSAPSRKSPRSLVQVQRQPPVKIDLRACGRRGRGRASRGRGGSVSLKEERFSSAKFDRERLESREFDSDETPVDDHSSPVDSPPELTDSTLVAVRPRRGRGSRGGRLAPGPYGVRKPRGRPCMKQKFLDQLREHDNTITEAILEVQRSTSIPMLEEEKCEDSRTVTTAAATTGTDFVAKVQHNNHNNSTSTATDSPSSNEIYWRKRQCEQLQHSTNHEHRQYPQSQQQNVEDEGSEEELQWSVMHTKSGEMSIDDKVRLLSKNNNDSSNNSVDSSDATYHRTTLIQSHSINVGSRENNSNSPIVVVNKTKSPSSQNLSPKLMINQESNKTNSSSPLYVDSNLKSTTKFFDSTIPADIDKRKSSNESQSPAENRSFNESKLIIADEMDGVRELVEDSLKIRQKFEKINNEFNEVGCLTSPKSDCVKCSPSPHNNNYACTQIKTDSNQIETTKESSSYVTAGL